MSLISNFNNFHCCENIEMKFRLFFIAFNFYGIDQFLVKGLASANLPKPVQKSANLPKTLA